MHAGMKIYHGGEYLDGAERQVPGSILDGTDPITLQATRENVTGYNPEKVLAPDEITDACGRLAAFCLDGYPVWGYSPVSETKVADLGTGSGSFLVSMLDGLQQPSDAPLAIHAVDLSSDALNTARLNVENSAESVPRPVSIFYDQSDYEHALTSEYDLIYFNPPYLERGHQITHHEASLAPETALYSEESSQEYERMLPVIREHLAEGGIAFVRLPSEDTKIDEWIREQMLDSDDLSLLLVTTDTERVGRFLAVTTTVFPRALNEYDYFFNYLGGKDERAQASSDNIPFYHDNQCRFELVRQAV